jgi:hypothetical protein
LWVAAARRAGALEAYEYCPCAREPRAKVVDGAGNGFTTTTTVAFRLLLRLGTGLWCLAWLLVGPLLRLPFHRHGSGRR